MLTDKVSHSVSHKQTLLKTIPPFAGGGAITSKIKHAIKLKTSPARLAQLLQPSLAFCFS